LIEVMPHEEPPPPHLSGNSSPAMCCARSDVTLPRQVGVSAARAEESHATAIETAIPRVMDCQRPT